MRFLNRTAHNTAFPSVDKKRTYAYMIETVFRQEMQCQVEFDL